MTLAPRTVRGMFNAAPIPVLIHTPMIVKAQAFDGRRFVYFETAREGVIDREGEDIAAAALERSIGLFLSQGDIDINHFAHLGNPYGTGARPEYRIGLPVDARRQGNSIFVKAEIFSNLTPPPEGSSGDWADKFWHGIAEMQPANRWFPSVFGNIKPGGVRLEERDGRKMRLITEVDWYSVGLAQRAQHPDLPAVSLEPMGNLAKAASVTAYSDGQPWVMSYETFAKAMDGGIATTSSGGSDILNRTGIGAFQSESLERKPVKRSYAHAMPRILAKVRRGTVKAKLEDLRKAFGEECECDDGEAGGYARKMLNEAARVVKN